MDLNLKAKLGRLSSAGPGSATRPVEAPEPPPLLPPDDRTAERRSRIERLRRMIGHAVGRQQEREARAPERPLEQDGADLPGSLRETPEGPVRLIERWLEPHHRHGRVCAADALGVDPEVVARLALDPALGGVDPRGMLLLDTETTGLSGGTGTLPFLIGLAWFEDQSLRVQQLFLRRPGEEGPMLHLLADRIARASCIVTYNGKAFDWPLLRTRFVMNRIALPALPPHLDLLHCARRILKPRLRAVRLVHLEAQVLGMHREDDVDGADIPRLYLGYLRGTGARPLLPVIEHNAHDLVALAAVLAELCRHYATVHPEDDPRDHLAYARLAERARDEERAHRFARAAAEGGGGAAVTIEACLLSARLARRAGDPDLEERALERALEVAEPGAPALAPDVRLALAKLHEHRRRDPAAALRHAPHTVPAEDAAARDRRVGRLERRLRR